MPVLTDRFIVSLKASTGRLEIKDDGCRGLSIRATSGRRGEGSGRKLGATDSSALAECIV
jgi:hypothetical protein